MFYNENRKCIEDYIELRPTVTKEDIEDLIDYEIENDVWSEMCNGDDFYQYFDWNPNSLYVEEMDIMFIDSDSKEEFLSWIKVTEDNLRNVKA